ncbi:VOC family protein [Pseudomonas sp. HN11]|uniref:VOC family protein n=1 Tax=Pseudomonas sp. HN11 TaxID=1344094 RepID=UPI001F265D28|nr:VOC family protein [Pseudomonas sp. HN11]UII68972.1 VOC family protein [Pseudomonas sp. HN11]
MLRFITLYSADTAAPMSAFLASLNSCAKTAGFELCTAVEGARLPEADGLILLVSAADSPDALDARLKALADVYRNKAVSVIRLHEGKAAHPFAEPLNATLLQDAACFIYPHGLALNGADGSLETVKHWLAGFSKFTAAIKMWRSLEGVSIAAAAQQSQRPQLAHINILTRDLEASQAFYREIFGARYCYNLGPHKVVMELNGFDFFIERNANFTYPAGYHIGIRALPEDVRRIADKVAADDTITLVKGNGPAPGYHHGPDNVRTAVYFEDPDGLVVEVYSTEIEMIETNRRLLLDRL